MTKSGQQAPKGQGLCVPIVHAFQPQSQAINRNQHQGPLCIYTRLAAPKPPGPCEGPLRTSNTSCRAGRRETGGAARLAAPADVAASDATSHAGGLLSACRHCSAGKAASGCVHAITQHLLKPDAAHTNPTASLTPERRILQSAWCTCTGRCCPGRKGTSPTLEHSWRAPCWAGSARPPLGTGGRG